MWASLLQSGTLMWAEMKKWSKSHLFICISQKLFVGVLGKSLSVWVCVCAKGIHVHTSSPLIVCKCRLERQWVTNVLLHIAGTIIRHSSTVHTLGLTATTACLNTHIKTYCRHTMAFNNNKVSFILEQPDDSHEDHIFLLFYSTQRNYTPLTQCKKRSTSFLFHAGCVISTFIRLIKRWPFYEISTDPPLHEVNSRQHYVGVSMEYQCCYLIPFIIFLQAATFTPSKETSPLVIWTWWKIFLCKIHEFITFEGIFHYWSIGSW